MRLLILGGTRFVGHAVAGAALGRGWEVTTFNQRLSGPDLANVRTLHSAGDTTQVVHPAPEAEPGHARQDNDGRFPDQSPVQVRYPRSKQEEQGDRIGATTSPPPARPVSAVAL